MLVASAYGSGAAEGSPFEHKPKVSSKFHVTIVLEVSVPPKNHRRVIEQLKTSRRQAQPYSVALTNSIDNFAKGITLKSLPDDKVTQDRNANRALGFYAKLVAAGAVPPEIADDTKAEKIKYSLQVSGNHHHYYYL